MVDVLTVVRKTKTRPDLGGIKMMNLVEYTQFEVSFRPQMEI